MRDCRSVKGLSPFNNSEARLPRKNLLPYILSMSNRENLSEFQHELCQHEIYKRLTDLRSLRHFMNYHVFAVWDFMSLLKALQKEITCVSVPWTPSTYSPELVRFINQIVVGEESDLDRNGNATSHFELYLQGMTEVGASPSALYDFLPALNLETLRPGVKEFVSENLRLAREGDPVEVAASFFFGREKLIPSMFTAMVEILKNENVEAPTFLYYLERHIQVDGEEHGPLAMKCLDALIKGSKEKEEMAMKAGLNALHLRKKLWDACLSTMP